MRVRGGDGDRVVAVARHGRAQVEVVHIFAVEEARAGLGLEALEKGDLLRLVPPVEQEERGDKDEERCAADRACDDVPLGRCCACAVVVGGEGGGDLREYLACTLV